jgi:hypothetical protein
VTAGEGDVAAPAASVPTVPDDFADLPPETAQWPMALGWVLTGYGILGIGANLCGAVSLHWYAPVMKWALGAEIPGPPLPLTVTTSVMSFAGVALGVVLVRGAWRMRTRNIRGLRLVQRWVMLRIALAVVGLAVGLLMLKNNVQWSNEVDEAVRQAERRRAEQAVSGPPPGMGGGRRRRGGMSMGGGGGPPAVDSADVRGPGYYSMQIGTVAMSAAGVSAMPLFTGFFLTARRRRDEWTRWSE